MDEDLWFDRIRSSARDNTILFVSSYILLISFLGTSFKILLGGDTTFSWSYFYLNTAALGILYFLMLSIHRLFRGQGSIKSSVIRVSSIFWLFAAAPLITYSAGGTISHLNLMDLSSMKTLLLSGGDINNGLLVIYTAALLMGIGITADSDKSRPNSLISGASGTLLTLISFAAVFSQYNLTGIKGTETSSLIYHKHLGTLFLILMLQLFVVVSISMFVWKRDVLRAFISNVKVFRSLHFVAITAIGFIVLSQVEPKAFEVSGLFDLPLLVLPPLCMFLTWQFTAMVNDIYDVEIDQMVHPDRPLVTGRIGPSIYRNAAVVFAVLSILISLYLGLLLALLNLSFTAAAMMYSKPPIRLKERVYGYVCVGYASVVSFYFGVYSHISWTLSVQRGRWFLFEGLPFYREVVSISLIIFAALSIAPYINALSDYEGDKKSDVTNIYMICGRPKGKKIVSVLIVFLFTSPLLLFYSVLDLIILIPVSLFAAYIFYVHEDHRPIFSLYFLVIVYSILRYTGLF